MFLHLFLKAKKSFPTCLSPDFLLYLTVQIWVTLLNCDVAPGKRTLLPSDGLRPGFHRVREFGWAEIYVFISL